MKIGFLGLGKMGKPMALNSLRANRDAVLFYARHREVCAELEELGARAAASVGALVAESDVCVIMLADEAQLTECLCPSGKLLDEISGEKLMLVCSTVGAECVGQFAGACAARGVSVADAPVSGGTKKAADGTLTMYLAGAEAACRTAERAAEPFARTVYRVGDRPGQAQELKLLNQLLVGVHMIAAAEVYVLAREAHMDLETVYRALTDSAGSSVIFRNRFPCLMEDDYTPKAAVRTLWKDTALAGRTFGRLETENFLLGEVSGRFFEAKKRGLEAEDMSAVKKMYDRDGENR